MTFPFTARFKPSKEGITYFFSPRIGLRVGLTAFPLMVGLHIVLLLLAKTPWQQTVINDSLGPVYFLLSAAGLTMGAYWSKRRSARMGLAWGLIALGVFFMFIAFCVTFVLQVILHQSSWPNLADPFLLACYPVFLIGAILLPAERISLREMVRLGLDSAVIMLSSTLLLWKFIIGPLLANGEPTPAALAISIAYPVGDLILLWALIMLIIRPHSRATQPKQPFWLLLGGCVCIIATDLLATSYEIAGIPPYADWLNVIYLVIALLQMLAGLRQAVEVTTLEESDTPARFSWPIRALRIGLPYLWVCGAFLAIAVKPSSQSFLSRSLEFAWVAVIIGLVLIRQMIALNENLRLTEALHRLNLELEQRVTERTAALTLANEDLRKREEQLAFNAFHDALTGLPNRLLLLEHLSQALRRLQRWEDAHFALLYLDFDGFKNINDSLGHLLGDRLLVDIAHRLRSSVREVDMVARLGGDEFVVLMEGDGGIEGATRAAERLREHLTQPFEAAGHRIFLTASMGVVLGDNSYQQPADILRDADLAMYEAKAQGKARSVIFTPEMRTEALKRLMLESDLRDALEHDVLRLHYQPIVDLATNKIAGFEALLRWQHPEYGFIPPTDFIPLAETSGLIVPITRWVLGQACRQIRAWQIEIPDSRDLTISVNLSPRLFTLTDLPKMVEQVLAETGLAPACLKLEMTEGAIIEEGEDTRSILNTWRMQGIQVHMDDFGTGYSSLSYLHNFPIDTLKIDRAFVSRIQHNGEQGEIVRTIITLARELNITVIAEGIETAEQLDFLKGNGCQCGQGFFISRPLDPAAAQAFLARQENQTVAA